MNSESTFKSTLRRNPINMPRFYRQGFSNIISIGYMIKTINAEYVFSTESERHTTEKDTFRNAILKVAPLIFHTAKRHAKKYLRHILKYLRDNSKYLRDNLFLLREHSEHIPTMFSSAVSAKHNRLHTYKYIQLTNIHLKPFNPHKRFGTK